MSTNQSNQTASQRVFDRDTVKVDTHGTHYRFDPAPAVNIKVRKGLSSLSPQQWEEFRSEAASLGVPQEFLQEFGPAYCEQVADEWWSVACDMGLEWLIEEAKALFGEDIKTCTAGRSGGWLCIQGLPELEQWEELKPGQPCPLCDEVAEPDEFKAYECAQCGESFGAKLFPVLKGSNLEGARFADGTELGDDPSPFKRWAFFEEVARAEADNVPHTIADLVLHNSFVLDYTTRPVEFLLVPHYDAPEGGLVACEVDTLDCPNLYRDNDALALYYTSKRPERAAKVARVLAYEKGGAQ